MGAKLLAIGHIGSVGTAESAEAISVEVATLLAAVETLLLTARESSRGSVGSVEVTIFESARRSTIALETVGRSLAVLAGVIPLAAGRSILRSRVLLSELALLVLSLESAIGARVVSSLVARPLRGHLDVSAVSLQVLQQMAGLLQQITDFLQLLLDLRLLARGELRVLLVVVALSVLLTAGLHAILLAAGVAAGLAVLGGLAVMGLVGVDGGLVLSAQVLAGVAGVGAAADIGLS